MSSIEKPKATYEQATAIDNARLGESFKVIAYAGTGKTTTLQMISDAMPERRGMYLAFNKAIASEAQQKFHRHVDCRTFHSLAFRSVPAWGHRQIAVTASESKLYGKRLSAGADYLASFDGRAL
ncbi:ABC-type branched-subunit amino acid transport system ATPase component [Acinetobacter baylyi]|nr:ABC-type branched-subunit amino acid transport system ATPase component [Acinetobacter baylyi]